MTRSRFPDPYEGMTSGELDRHFTTVLSDHRKRQQAISIRFPAELLTGIRSLAREHGVPYQTLIKQLLERDVERLQARQPISRRAIGTPTTTSRRRTTGKPTASKGQRSSPSAAAPSRTGKRKVAV